jgi:hypothetical protein
MKKLTKSLKGYLDRCLEEEVEGIDFEAIASFMDARGWLHYDGAPTADSLRDLVRDLWRTVRDVKGTISSSTGGFTVELCIDGGNIHGVEVIFDATPAFRRERFQ